MKLTLLILAVLFSAGSIWCGITTWIAGQGTGTDSGYFAMYGFFTLVTTLIALGLFIGASILNSKKVKK